MAQAGFTPISLYYSTTAATAPTAGNLVSGELALNITDGKLYFKNNSGVVTLLAGISGAGPAAGSNTQVQFNNSGVLGASAGLTFNGTDLATTGRYIVNNAGSSAGITDISLGALSGGSFLNTPTGTTGYLAVAGNAAQAYTSTSHLWYTSASERMRLDASGNLGIGTTSPGVRLDVSGADGVRARVVATSGGTSGMVLSSAGNTAYTIKAGNADNSLRIDQDGTDRLTLASGGNVGIGTTSPGNRLHVVGSGDISRFTNGTVSLYGYSDSAGLGWFTGAGATGTGVYYNNTSSYQALYTGGTERMRLDASGNLGIGTSSPGSALDVRFATNPVTNNGIGSDALRAWTTSALAANSGGAISLGGTATSGGVGAAFAQIAGRKTNATSADYAGYLQFAVNNSGGTMFEAMRLDASGNLGIGTASPAAPLDVVGTFQWRSNVGGTDIWQRFTGGTGLIYDGTTTATDLAWIRNGAEQMRLTSTGLGIGTSSPIQKLHVGGNGNIYASGGATWYTGGDLFIRAGSGGKLRLGANDANDFAILDASGNLGLGVTPSAWGGISGAALELKGNAYIASTTQVLSLATNTYFNGTNWIYKTTGPANRYDTFSGQHIFYTAPSGTAGNAITFTQAMTLDASGNLLVGTTSSYRNGRVVVKDVNRSQASTNANLHVSTTDTQAADIGGSIALGGQVDGSNEAPFAYISGRKENNTSGSYAGYFAVSITDGGAGTNERMRITSTGNVGIGTNTFGTSAAGVLALANGTAPTTGPADTVQIFSVDRSAGNTIPAVRCEGSGVTNAGITNTTVTNKIAIQVNGTIYYLLATTNAT